MRSDAELYSDRFRQVDTDRDGLEGSIKFMDGSPKVYNRAVTGQELQLEIVDHDMVNILSDKQNLICASDTYFNPDNQRCSRYPFSGGGGEVCGCVTCHLIDAVAWWDITP